MAIGVNGIPTIRIRGKLGNVVFIPSGESLVMREYVKPEDPRTPGQMRARSTFAQASRWWQEVSDSQFAEWQAYGQRIGKNPFSAFVSLTAKWLTLHPGGTPPLDPPTSAFTGDSVRLTPSPSDSEIRVTCDRANAAGVVTEILIQPKANVRRKPNPKNWVTGATVAFTHPGQILTIPAKGRSAYGIAYRFVDEATGQTTDQYELPSIVGPWALGPRPSPMR